MRSYEPAARLRWDPGQWSSPDPDLVSAMSSLAIASSCPEDLATVDPDLDFRKNPHPKASASISHGTALVLLAVRGP